LDASPTWFEWRQEAPNYIWPDDKTWIVATEIEGFSTYVGAPKKQIDQILESPFFEAFPCELTDRFDGIGDPINGEPWDESSVADDGWKGLPPRRTSSCLVVEPRGVLVVARPQPPHM